jgi:hypothetical protein
LAKKSRTPPPPRRPVQAPKQRSAPRTESERRTFLYVVGFAASGLLILAAVLGFVAFAGGGSDGGGGSGSRAVTSSEDCVEREYDGLAPRHLQNVDAKVNYNSFPPSSGPHYQQPAPWGIYEEPIKQTILVHNLEHGGIILQYGPGVGDEAEVQIRSFYQDDPYGLVVAPNPKLKDKIALTAWNEPRYRAEGEFEDVDPGNGFVLTCSKVNEGDFAKFRDAHRNKAGERYPSVKDMAPGA